VLKQGSWNLISCGTATVDVIVIDQLRATRLTTQQFTPPAVERGNGLVRSDE